MATANSKKISKPQKGEHLKPHHFKPGQSGNPNGRPKIPPEVVELARLHTKDAILTFVDVMQNGVDEKARSDAADRLLNRAWGKPTEKVELTGEDGGPIEQVTKAYVSGIDFTAIVAAAKKAKG